MLFKAFKKAHQNQLLRFCGKFCAQMFDQVLGQKTFQEIISTIQAKTIDIRADL